MCDILQSCLKECNDWQFCADGGKRQLFAGKTMIGRHSCMLLAFQGLVYWCFWVHTSLTCKSVKYATKKSTTTSAKLYPSANTSACTLATVRNNAQKFHRQCEARAANDLEENLPTKLQKALTICSEKGASSWLSALPISEHGFALHKGAFRDALCLRYGWRPSHLPSHCVCGHHFTIKHALSCSRGGFPSIRHNEIRNITADLLSGVCHGVGTEPSLQPVTGEQLEHRTANREDGARLDIVAQNFWGRDRQSAFFDVRVFNPYAPCYRSSTLPQCYRKNELEKKRAYEERVREIEHGSFSPLVFSAAGGMGTIATVVYKRLASLLAEKQGRPYSSTLHWLRCRLNFSLLRSAIMCIRGSRSIFSRDSTSPPMESIDLALHEGQVPAF